MKIRNGFVSNSSSSSFIILLNNITSTQKDMIYNHISLATEIDEKLLSEGKELIYEYYDEWNIQEDGFSLWCSTTMDNFDLYTFITDVVGIDDDKIRYIGDGYDDDLSQDKDYINLKRSYILNDIKNNINNDDMGS